MQNNLKKQFSSRCPQLNKKKTVLKQCQQLNAKPLKKKRFKTVLITTKCKTIFKKNSSKTVPTTKCKTRENWIFVKHFSSRCQQINAKPFLKKRFKTVLITTKRKTIFKKTF